MADNDPLSLQPQEYRDLIEDMRVGVYLIQEDRFVYVNRRLAELFGYSRDEMLQLPSVLDLIAASDRPLVAEKLRQRISGEITVLDYSVKGLRKNGKTIDLDVRSTRTTHQGRPAVMGTMVDVTDRRRLEETLRHQSIRDELTGLYNRRGFLTLSEGHLALAKRHHRSLVLLFADLDSLKLINDLHGHAAGDRALVAAAKLLRQTYRTADVIARIGGDEFVVFPLEAAPESAERLVARLERQAEGYNREGHEPFTLSFSVGIGHWNAEDCQSVQDLLDAADRALYERKRERRGRTPQAGS